MKLNNRGLAIGDLPAVVITLVIVGVALSLGATVMGNMKNSSEDANANLTIDDTVDGLRELASWQDTIAIVVAAAIILGLLALFYRGR